MEEREKYYIPFSLKEGVKKTIETEMGNLTLLKKKGLLHFERPATGVMGYDKFSEDGNQYVSYRLSQDGEEWEVVIALLQGNRISRGYIILECMGETQKVSEVDQFKLKNLLEFGDITDIITDYYP